MVTDDLWAINYSMIAMARRVPRKRRLRAAQLTRHYIRRYRHPTIPEARLNPKWVYITAAQELVRYDAFWKWRSR